MSCLKLVLICAPWNLGTLLPHKTSLPGVEVPAVDENIYGSSFVEREKAGRISSVHICVFFFFFCGIWYLDRFSRFARYPKYHSPSSYVGGRKEKRSIGRSLEKEYISSNSIRVDSKRAKCTSFFLNYTPQSTNSITTRAFTAA